MTRRTRAHHFASSGRRYNRDAEKVVRAGHVKQARGNPIKLRKLGQKNKTPFVVRRTYTPEQRKQLNSMDWNNPRTP